MLKKVFGKTIKLFLLDGISNGRMTCELSNWTGKAYKLPRNMIKDDMNRQELSSTGVYFLFGRSDITSEKDLVYIGEAENVISRLKEHLKDETKDYWNEVVVFVSKDDNLNKAFIKYLESRLYKIAVNVNRYTIKNGNTPTQSSLSKPEEAEMDEFLENIKMLTNVLGFKVFEELIQESTDDSENLFIQAARGANAKAQQTASGFVVFKGSEITSTTVDSYPDGWKKIRQDLIDNKIIISKDGKWIFSQDHLFNSPSAAAAIVMGRSANGLNEWKNKKGTSLKEM